MAPVSYRSVSSRATTALLFSPTLRGPVLRVLGIGDSGRCVASQVAMERETGHFIAFWNMEGNGVEHLRGASKEEK